MFRALILLSYFVRWIPRGLRLALGDGLGWIWFSIVRFRRSVVLDNLRLALGSEIPQNELRTLALRNFQHYGRMLLEIVRSISFTDEDYGREVIVDGWEHLEPYLAAGKGGFLLTCHLGNWEVGVGALVRRGAPLDIVVKRAGDPRAEKLLQWYRKKIGAGIIVESGTAKDILRAIQKGRFVGFMLDQFMGPPIGLPVRFFGKPAGTAVGLALLTEKREIPVIPGYTFRDGEGRLHAVLGPALPLDDLPEEKEERLFVKTQRFNDALESMIRQHPEQWLWLHRRWKEYRGVPRWQPKRALVLLLLLALTAAPILRADDEPTGIPIPPDPKISMPTFKPLPAGEEDDVPVVTSPTVKTEAKPEAKVADEKPAKGKHKKDRKGRKLAKTPAKTVVVPPVAVTAKSTKLFDVTPPSKIPFEIGERLEIDLGWTAIPAGRAIMEVKEGPSINGHPTYWYSGNVTSNRVVDTIYHVNNTIESFVDKHGLIPYKFLLHMFESKQKKETRVAFDHPEGKALYWSKRVSERWGNDTQDRTDTLVPGAQDMFSALYYARVLNYKLNEKQKVNVFENGKNYEIELLPVANELVTSKVGVFQCWKILVSVNLQNALRPTGDMYLWLSDDSKRYIVKFDAKIKIGSLVGNLTKIRERQLSSIQESK